MEAQRFANAALVLLSAVLPGVLSVHLVSSESSLYVWNINITHCAQDSQPLLHSPCRHVPSFLQRQSSHLKEAIAVTSSEDFDSEDFDLLSYCEQFYGGEDFDSEDFDSEDFDLASICSNKYKEKWKNGLESIREAHTSAIHTAFDFTPQCNPHYTAALASVDTVIAFCYNFMQFIDNTYIKYSINKFGSNKAWYLTTKLPTALMWEMSNPG